MNQTNEFREGLDELASHYQEILQLLGENPDREGLEKTPMRVAKAMQVLIEAIHRTLNECYWMHCLKKSMIKWSL